MLGLVILNLKNKKLISNLRWGYTDGMIGAKTYMTKNGKQMKAIWNMVKDLTGSA
jgi:hypothetical protein